MTWAVGAQVATAAITACATGVMAWYARELNAMGKRQAKEAADSRRLRLQGLRQAAEFELFWAEALLQNPATLWQAILLKGQRQSSSVVPADVPSLFEALGEDPATEVLGALRLLDEMYSTLGCLHATLERSYWLYSFFVPVPSNPGVKREVIKLARQTLPFITKAQSAAGFRRADQTGGPTPP